MAKRMAKQEIGGYSLPIYIPKGLFLRQKPTNMKTSIALQPLNMLMVPATDRTLVFEDEFMLCDNIGQPANDFIGREVFIAPDRPFKTDFTLLMFCTQGEMQIRLNLQEYTFRAGMALVVLPGDIGECLSVGPECQVALIAFTDNNYMDGDRSSQSLLLLKYLMKERTLSLTSTEQEEMLSVYQWMRRKIEQPDFGFTRGILRSYMQVLVYLGYQWLARHHREQPDAERPQNRPQELFERFLALVQKHYAEERSIRFYADRLCLTPKYLSNAVHRVSGRHAGEWIKDYVLLEAKALLKSRQYTVQQVSEMLNFPNTSFFGKFFKKAVGCTPRTYMLE